MSSGWRGMLWPSRGAIAVKMDDGGTPPGSNHSLCPPALVHPARPPRSSIKYGWGPSVPTSQLNHLNLVSTHTHKKKLCKTLLPRAICPLRGMWLDCVRARLMNLKASGRREGTGILRNTDSTFRHFLSFPLLTYYLKKGICSSRSSALRRRELI